MHILAPFRDETLATSVGALMCSVTAVCACAFGAGPAQAAERVVVANPYAGIDWDSVEQHKANLHTHTTQSDGVLEPAEVVAEYRRRGYGILAISDHDRCTWPWADHDPKAPNPGIVPVAGNELSRHHHTLSLFCDFATENADLESVLDEVATADGLAVLCHPAMHWLRGWGRQVPGLRVEIAPALRKVAQGDFTVEAWFRTTSVGRNIIMGNYDRSTTGHLNLELHTDNRVRVFVSPPEGENTVDLRISGDELNIDTRDGKWHHLAGIRSAGKVLLYLDGQLISQALDTAGPFDLGGEFYFLGRDSRTGSTTFEGELDEIRLWRRALSAKEIAASYHGKPAGSDGGPAADGLVARYALETVGGKPIVPGSALTRAADDSADFAAGPFPALPTPQGAPVAVAEVPAALQRSKVSAVALRFTEGRRPGRGVPDGVVASYARLMREHSHLLGIEVLNGTRSLSEHALDRELWDQLLVRLMPERPVWGFSNDDMHRPEHLGRDWIWVLARQLDEASVREAIQRGQFFLASTRVHTGTRGAVAATPQIERLDHNPDAGTLEIVATENGQPVGAEACSWISDGRVVHTGLKLRYRTTPGIGGYVRAELSGQGGKLLTNPIGVKREE